MEFFNDVNTENSLYHDALGLLGISESNTTIFPIATFTRLVNAKYQDLAYLGWKYSQEWEFDDSNYETFPTATTTLVVGQKDYTISSNALDILGVSVLNSAGDYVRLKYISELDIQTDPDEFFETSGMPRYYDVKGNSVVIYPAPSAAETTSEEGLKLFLSRTPDLFAIDDTDKEPGVPAILHRYISVGSALDFAMGNEYVNKIPTLKIAMKEETDKAIDYFSNRGKQKKVALKTRHKIRI